MKTNSDRKLQLSLGLICCAGITAGIFIFYSIRPAITGRSSDPESNGGLPVLHDDSLKVQLVAQGFQNPTSMRFLHDGSILVSEKNDGQIKLVLPGNSSRADPENMTYTVQKSPVLIEDRILTGAEQGMLGIAVLESADKASGKGTNTKASPSVFIYMTENESGTARNRVYEYSYNEKGHILEHRSLIIDLPALPGPYHNSGKIAIGPDGYLYAVIGDLSSGGGLLDNQINGRPLNDRGVIIRVDKNTGAPAIDNPFYGYNGTALDKLKSYYAYGIRNSFGMDFDPVTGKLWMTENGPDRYDEINLVEPGFNSGWHKIIGPLSRNNGTTTEDLVVYNGSRYADPVFSWYVPVGVTDIEFFKSAKLGQKYENNIFVGDINHGNLYYFKINKNRDGLDFGSNVGLSDKVADPIGGDTLGEVRQNIIAENFVGRITDVETGPDGYLYVLTYFDGKIWRITNS